MDYRSFFIKLLIAFCLVVNATQNEDGSAELIPSPRIVSGGFAALGQFPYQVSVRLNNQHICGGALISKRFVVTAAHCVYYIDYNTLSVQAGTVSRTNGGEIRAVSTVITHPLYGFSNDIALIQIEAPFNYSDVIKPVAITTWDVPAGELVAVSGWGRVYEGGPLSDILRYTKTLKTLKNEECAKANGTVDPGILCLLSPQAAGFCDGDDGGPAVYRNILIGIASSITNGCGSMAKGGFTKLAYYKGWIDAVVTGLVQH